jgi:hypothetical protein
MLLQMKNHIRLFAHVMGHQFEVRAICLDFEMANAIMEKHPTLAVISENNGLIFLAEVKETK